jgi:hypothetical protein
MAKKKAKAMKREAPAKTQKSSSMGWIIAAVVVIVIIAFLVMKPGKQAPTGPQAPTEQPTTKGTLLTESTAPEFQTKCLNAIGVVPGTQVVENGVLSVTFKNNGRSGVEGTYFEFVDAQGNKRFKRNPDAIGAGETISYQVDLNQVGAELGSSVKTFVIYPIEAGKACLNQRRQIISG